MTSVPHGRPNLAPARPFAATGPRSSGLRLRMKPAGEPTGYVDGGWWPRSRDLTVELVTLAAEVGRVITVQFGLGAWEPAPDKYTVDGHVVRLEGSATADPYVVRLSMPEHRRISLLVVPPEVTAAAAHDAMMTAARADNAERPVAILAAGRIVPDGSVRRLRLVRSR